MLKLRQPVKENCFFPCRNSRFCSLVLWNHFTQVTWAVCYRSHFPFKPHYGFWKLLEWVPVELY